MSNIVLHKLYRKKIKNCVYLKCKLLTFLYLKIYMKMTYVAERLLNNYSLSLLTTALFYSVP